MVRDQERTVRVLAILSLCSGRDSRHACIYRELRLVAVVSTQTFVTTPPTTRAVIPSERRAWSSPVELNVP